MKNKLPDGQLPDGQGAGSRPGKWAPLRLDRIGHFENPFEGNQTMKKVKNRRISESWAKNQQYKRN